MNLASTKGYQFHEVHLIHKRGRTAMPDAVQYANDNYLEVTYAPETANLIATNLNEELWNNAILTRSLKLTGSTRQGAKVVIIAHVPHFYDNHENIRATIQAKTQRDGAGPVPQDELDRLEKLNGFTKNGIRRVSVLDYDDVKSYIGKTYSLEEALQNPQTVPIFGSQQNAQHYLASHRFKRSIEVWNKDDYYDDAAMGRFLLFGDDGSFSGGFLSTSGEGEVRVLGLPKRQVK